MFEKKTVSKIDITTDCIFDYIVDFMFEKLSDYMFENLRDYMIENLTDFMLRIRDKYNYPFIEILFLARLVLAERKTFQEFEFLILWV